MAKNVGHNGRRAEPRHVRLYHSITGCEAWADLSGNAVKLLIALARLDKGGSNGELFLSAREAAKAIGVSINTAWRAFTELESHGFIAATQRGCFKPGQRPATKWRLTWLAAPGTGPTRDFERWTPDWKQTPSQKLIGSVSKIETVVETPSGPVLKFATEPTEASHVSKPPAVSNIATQVVSHGLGADSCDYQQRKHANNGERHFRDLLDEEATDQLRERLTAYLDTASVGAQSRLAETARIPSGTLSKFKEGRGLPAAHFVNLQLALTNAQQKDAA